MSMVDWYVEGVEFGNCNCDYGCPCQFDRARPTATAAASRSCGSTRDISARFRSTGCALPCSMPGQARSSRATARCRRSSTNVRRRAAQGPRHHPPWRRDGGGGDPLVGLPRHVEHRARADLQADRVRGRHREAAGAGGHPGRARIQRPADPQPRHRRRAPGAHRHPERHRVRAGRDRQRHDQGVRGDRARSGRHLRPVQRARHSGTGVVSARA